MRSRDLAAKLPSTGRRLSFQWKIAAAITFVIAVASITLSTVMHQTFSHNQEDAARAAADRNLQLVLQDETGSMRALFRATTDGLDVPEELRQAVAGGKRATYLVNSGDQPFVWAAADVNTQVVAIRVPYTAQRESIASVDRTLRNATIAVIAAGAVLGVLLGLAMSYRLRSAARAARKVSTGANIRVRSVTWSLFDDEITELADAVDAMSDALRGQLDAEKRVTANIAHDLRTPISGLVGAAELLPPGRPTELVRDGVHKLRRLAEDVIEVARLDTTSEQADIQSVELVPVVHHAISTTGVECEVRVHGTPVSYTDARRLERIIANVILNARNHGKPPINVDVDHSRITVRDRGSGFTEEWLRQGPKRFQTDCVERGPNSGLGLGLTIVVGQAAVIGARINFSNHPNGGAVVTIDLPECPPDEFA